MADAMEVKVEIAGIECAKCDVYVRNPSESELIRHRDHVDDVRYEARFANVGPLPQTFWLTFRRP